MKTLLLFSSLVFLVSACMPKDPEVLTKEDKAFIENRKMGGKVTTEAGRAKVPQKMEIALGALVEGRLLQAQRLLALAQDLVANKKDSVQVGCVNIRKKSAGDDSKSETYRMSFLQCKTGNEQMDLMISGTGLLQITATDDGGVKAVVYSDRSAGESAVEVMTSQAFKKGAKDTLTIRESSELRLTQSGEPANYALEISPSHVELQSGFMETLTGTELSMDLTALISKDKISSVLAEVRGQAVNLKDESAQPQTFSLILRSLEEAGSAAYTLQFGRGVRDGKMQFADTEITTISRNEKIKRDEKSAVPRKKGTAIENSVPWDFWF